MSLDLFLFLFNLSWDINNTKAIIFFSRISNKKNKKIFTTKSGSEIISAVKK
jgi:hypothetical protein